MQRAHPFRLPRPQRRHLHPDVRHHVRTLLILHHLPIIITHPRNTLQLVGCLPTIALLDQAGRRRLLLIGSTLLVLCHTAVAAIIGRCYQDWSAHHGAGWAGVALVFTFMLSYGATWGPVSWALPPEVFPSSIRAKGVAISVATLWFCNFIVSGSHLVDVQGRR